ncbi:MAG: sodium:solute symporter family protein [Candidatus Lariskella arthropodorum]
MHIIDIIIVVAYLVLCMLIGLYQSRSIKTLKEYTLGKGSFSDIVIITTVFATSVGAGVLNGATQQAGLYYIFPLLLYPFMWLFLAHILGQGIDQFLGMMSVAEIMEKLYGNVARWTTNFCAILLAIFVLAAQVIAICHIINYFFGIEYHKGAAIAALTLALYSSLGGIRAVAFTDVFQFVVIMIMIPIAFSDLYHHAGGYRGIHSAPQGMFKIDLNSYNILNFLSLILYNLFAIHFTGPPFIQRFLMCKNSTQLTHCLNIVAIISFFFINIICIIGFILKIKNSDMANASNILLLQGIIDYASVGFKGLIIAGLLAIMMSTADSWLNTTSVLISYDIIGKIVPTTERWLLFIARTVTFVLCIPAVALAGAERELLSWLWLAGNFWSTIITVPLIAGFLKFRTNSKSFISATTIAILSSSISGYIVGDLATISLMFGMIGSAVGLFGMHYWQVHQGVLTHLTQEHYFCVR